VCAIAVLSAVTVFTEGTLFALFVNVDSRNDRHISIICFFSCAENCAKFVFADVIPLKPFVLLM
jgi:hypothetical protein